MGKLKKALLISFSSLFAIVLFFVLFAVFTPHPTTWAIRALFSSTSYSEHVDL